MNRGQISLYSNVFPSSLEKDPSRKGTRNVFQDERDTALAHRYYYYIHVKRWRYDDTLVKLEKEFFLTADYIGTLLMPKIGLVKELISNDTKPHKLKGKYPQWTWL